MTTKTSPELVRDYLQRGLIKGYYRTFDDLAATMGFNSNGNLHNWQRDDDPAHLISPHQIGNFAKALHLTPAEHLELLIARIFEMADGEKKAKSFSRADLIKLIDLALGSSPDDWIGSVIEDELQRMGFRDALARTSKTEALVRELARQLATETADQLVAEARLDEAGRLLKTSP